ncbi:MAG TPA: M20/M25/M40 family metallo-hydrolase [Candidatus Aphodousia faecipullorum]|nr:M20/M25/M40 family metallo-hydrolase [Candidatus Aphodousia faecipullorum]
MQKTRCALAVGLAMVAGVAWAVVPQVSPDVQKATETIYKDPVMQKMLTELTSDENAQFRFNTHMEIARIASPSRYEMRRAEEITRRMLEEWGFDKSDIMTTPEGIIKGAGIQKVDGLPVYNVCVRIPGTYSQEKDAKSYKGQFPKVLLEGHTDTVNPAVLPPADSPYEPVKLQKASDAIVTTPAELAALKDELHFDKNGKIIQDENYKKAYVRYANLEDAQKKGGYRIYVPGFADAMGNTTSVLTAAIMLKKYNIKPVYDIWVCGTTGEEGKGNLCGMKQLYGYNQDTGKGNNALNFVANFGADSTRAGSGIFNYLGSYRFEIKYTEPAGYKMGGQDAPSALMAMTRSIAKIADLKTAWDTDKKAERTTYTVGVADCEDATDGSRSRSCTLMVDMRSPTQGPLSEIRSRIEPTFKAALDEENAKYGLKAGDKNAVKMELVWFGDRPAYSRPDYNDVASQIYWQTAQTVGIDKIKELPTGAASLNDNVPAAVGVPTVNFNVHTPAASGGGHTFNEWGIPGDNVAEGKRIFRMILMGLTAAGYHTSDGQVIAPAADPIGARTTEDMY